MKDTDSQALFDGFAKSTPGMGVLTPEMLQKEIDEAPPIHRWSLIRIAESLFPEFAFRGTDAPII